MNKVYGIMVTSGGIDEMLWDKGVWETELAAKEYIDENLSNITGLWVGELKVNDPIATLVDKPAEEMVTCNLCGVQYNAADVNLIDYEEAVCINCEPEYDSFAKKE